MIDALLTFAVMAAVFVLASELRAIRSRRRLADVARSRMPAPAQRASLRR